MLLGAFPIGLLGRVGSLQTQVSNHLVDTSTAHGAASTNDYGKIIKRDAFGRAQVSDPVASADIATRGWVLAQGFTGGSGTVYSVATGTGLSGGPITGAGTISLANTGVTPGTYSYPSITVNAQGQITAAANGPGLLTNITVTAPLVTSGGLTPNLSINPATSLVAGSMSASDKAKLDGIAAGAQVNTVASVFGRTGAIVAQTGDYNIQKIAGFTISTSPPSGGSDGDVWIQVG